MVADTSVFFLFIPGRTSSDVDMILIFFVAFNPLCTIIGLDIEFCETIPIYTCKENSQYYTLQDSVSWEKTQYR